MLGVTFSSLKSQKYKKYDLRMSSFKRKKNWRSQGGEGVRTVVLGSRKGAIFHYVTALFVFACKVLSILYRGTPCFNSNKNRSAMEHRGFEHGSPRQEPSAYQCAEPSADSPWAINYLYINC